jgi:uncharacterized membrane protein
VTTSLLFLFSSLLYRSKPSNIAHLNKLDLKSSLIRLKVGILAVIEGMRDSTVLILVLFRAGSVFKRYEVKRSEEELVVTAFLRHGADSLMTIEGAAHTGMKPDETAPTKGPKMCQRFSLH